LAKKAAYRAPAVVAAQNNFIKKLGLSSESELNTTDFESYVKLFNYGLSNDQVKHIWELFKDKVDEAGISNEIMPFE
jgi:hypothetical protein